MRDVLEVLEFPRVRALLAERAKTPLGRELALALAPLPREEAEKRHELTGEALSYPYALPEAGTLREAYGRALAGARLSGPELLKAAKALEEAMALKEELLPLKNALSQVAEGIGDHTPFLERVRKALDEEGAVKDEASPRLAQIRRELRPLRQQILDRLYALMDRHREAFQDRFVTLRRERYCVPVRAGMAQKVPGILLDESESGATLFIEPFSVVKLNNRLQALRLKEEEEVNRILRDLSERLAKDEGVPKTLEALGLLDLVQAQAALARDLGLSRPAFGERYELYRAFHPLIPDAVRNSFALDEKNRILLISGPNMGGKTALLKTLGLAVLMAQSGLFVAAEKALLAWPDRVYADIGDEQSLQENLSTFAGHLRRLREMLEEATSHSLVLIDELGSGTDPEEGAALSQAILEALLERGVKGMVTTHLSPLKAFAQGREGIQNASMRFDLEALRPTYELVLGVPLPQPPRGLLGPLPDGLEDLGVSPEGLGAFQGDSLGLEVAVPAQDPEADGPVALGEAHRPLHVGDALRLLNEVVQHGVQENDQGLHRVRVLPLLVVEEVQGGEAADEALLLRGGEHDLRAEVRRLDGSQVLLIGFGVCRILVKHVRSSSFDL